MNYKTYAEAKIANPDCEVFKDGKEFHAVHGLKSSPFGKGWLICNPAAYCSTLKEFLEAGFKLVDGDMFIGANCTVVTVVADCQSSRVNALDSNRYILSAAALNGGCKIPAKVEQWTIYNNTLPLCELTDEQAAQLFNAWRAGGEVECTNTTTKDLRSGLTTFEWSIPSIINWDDYLAYRIKPKSERELFIDKSMEVCKENQHNKVEFMLGKIYDAGARYKDLTQHFGENI